jgi:hypothetical protein
VIEYLSGTVDGNCFAGSVRVSWRSKSYVDGVRERYE